MYHDKKQSSDGVNNKVVGGLDHFSSGPPDDLPPPFSAGGGPYSVNYPEVKSMLDPVQPLRVNYTSPQPVAPASAPVSSPFPAPAPVSVPAPIPASTNPNTPAPYKPKRKPLKRVPVNHGKEHDEGAKQNLTPLPDRNSQQEGYPVSNSEAVPLNSSHIPLNHQQSTSKGSLTSNSISSSPTKSASSLYTVPSNPVSGLPMNMAIPSYVAADQAHISVVRSSSPSQMGIHASVPGPFPSQVPSTQSVDMKPQQSEQSHGHVKTLSGSSFDFVGEKGHFPRYPPGANPGPNLTNPDDQSNGYYNQSSNSPNINPPYPVMSSNPQLSRADTDNSGRTSHNRNSSIRSNSSAKSQKLFMTPIQTPAKGTAAPSSVGIPKQFSLAQKRLSMTSSFSSGPSTSPHRRLDSTSSRVSRTSSDLQHSNVSGSFYVHELRRRSATTWCDIPASVWGVPIGIAEAASLKSSLASRQMSQRRTIDIRHSHLAPRLLASEADDSDYDGASINTTIEGMTSGTVSRSESSSALKIPESIIESASDVVSIKSSATLSSPRLPDSDSQQTGANNPRLRSRSPSVDSVKSIEEGTQKIRLFVANPDADSD